MNSKVKIIVFSLFCYFCKPCCCNEEQEWLTEDEMLEIFGTTNASAPNYGFVGIDISHNRVKRDTGYVWRLSVPFTDGTTKHFNFNKTDGVLAGPETPVWQAWGSPNSDKVDYKRTTDLKSLGRFEFFQDFDQKAAIVVFHDLNRIEGFTEYHRFREVIRNTKPTVPRKPLAPGMKYATRKVIRSRKYILVPKRQTPFIRTRGIPVRARSQRDTSGHETLRFDPTPKTVYPQLLIQLDRSDVKGNGSEILMKTLLYWCGVDMLYSKLEYPQVKINIAGIILPMNDFTAPWVKKAMYPGYDDFIDDSRGLRELGAHFARNINVFPTAEYDFMISFISKKLDPSGLVLGAAYTDVTCTNRPAHAAVLHSNLSTYIVGAHELAHLLSAHHDDTTVQCASNLGIMGSYTWGGESNFYWSNCAQNSIRKYFRKKKTECLDNCPRTKPDCGAAPAFKGLELDCVREPSEKCRKYGKFFSGELTCDGGILCVNGDDKMLVGGYGVDGVLCKWNDPSHIAACHEGKCVPIHHRTPRCRKRPENEG